MRFSGEKRDRTLPHSEIPLPLAITLSSISKGRQRRFCHASPPTLAFDAFSKKTFEVP